jgi:hypothetical protein
MNPFAIYIGAEFPGTNIQVQDLRFVVADAIEETYAALRRDWWSMPRSLRINCGRRSLRPMATMYRCVPSRSPGPRSCISSTWADTNRGVSRNATATFSSWWSSDRPQATRLSWRHG